MKKTMATVVAALVLASAGSLLAHHSLANFDTTKGINVRGTIVFFQQVNPHSFLYIDETDKNGHVHRWAIEGPAVSGLNRMGITATTLKAGDIIEACGYITKEGVPSERTANSEPISESLKDKSPKSVTGQVLTAEWLKTPDGTKRSWSDYGHHKCFPADYQDIHTR